MKFRRHFLIASLAVFLIPQMSHAAEESARRTPENVIGDWTLSANQNSTDSSDHANLRLISKSTVLLTVRGELSKALGGPVELTLSSQGTLVGVSKSGTDVSIEVIDKRNLGMTLRGKGLLFSVFLVR